MSEQYKLFKASGKPTDEALRTGELELSDAEKFLALTGVPLSSYLELTAAEIGQILMMNRADANAYLLNLDRTEKNASAKNWWDKM